MNELLKMLLQQGIPPGMGGIMPGTDGGKGNALQNLIMPQMPMPFPGMQMAMNDPLMGLLRRR